ncbi:MAG: response regulator [Candidatus Moranbacteria bacterium]|nr:response regulator [Candidatus Moranbacteria bacterium]
MKTLIVEDEEECATYLSRCLKENGHTVDWENNGEKAFWKARFSSYDLLLVDIQVPNKNGLEILTDLRKMKNHTPMIIITAEKSLDVKIQSFGIGVDDYLIKPFAVQELVARIGAIKRRNKKLLRETKKIGPLEIDHTSFRVLKDNQELKLRRKEYDLLYYFIQNPNQAISRTNLLEKVWDLNADPFTNTVDVHIKNLRKKIGDSKGQIIRTIYGRGYEFALDNINKL